MITHTPHDLSISQRRLIDLIRCKPKLTRADLGAATGLTAGAISRLVRDLLEMGVIKELERISGMRGQPAVPLEVSGGGGISIGVSFPYGRLDVVAMNYAGVQIAHFKTPLEGRNQAELKQILQPQISELLGRKDLVGQRLVGVGLSIPGHLRLDGPKEFVIPPTLDWLDVPELCVWLGNAFKAPVFVENIANAAAIAEAYAAPERMPKDLAAINFGHGVGIGLMVSGRIHQGTGGMAGEVGALFPSADPRPSAHDLLMVMRSAGRDVPTVTDLNGFPVEGDTLIDAWVVRAAQQLTPLVRMLNMITAPQQIVLTGMLPTNVVAMLAGNLTERMAHPEVGFAMNPARIMPSKFDTLANVIGAAWLPIESEGWQEEGRINWAS